MSKGCPRTYPDEGLTLQPSYSKHAVRCCNGAGNVCDSDKTGFCYGITTYEKAEKICSDLGERLCYHDEIENCCGTGCEYDHETAWVKCKRDIAILLWSFAIKIV